MSDSPDPPGGRPLSFRYALSPDWDPADAPRRLYLRLPGLWVTGLLGAYLLSIVSLPIAEMAGFRSILSEQLDELTVVDQLIFVVVAAPLLEETIYRLVLARQLRLPLLVLSGLLSGALFWGAHPLVMGLGPLVGILALVAWAHRPTGVALAAWWADNPCLLYTSPSPRDGLLSRMPSSA